MVVGEETPDEGEVSVPNKLAVGYFRQDVEEMKDRSVLDGAIANIRRLRKPASGDSRGRDGGATIVRNGFQQVVR